MEHALKIFQNAITFDTEDSRANALLALNSIAFDPQCGEDNLFETESKCTRLLTDLTLFPNAKSTFAPWVLICTLLSNVNYLENWAKNHPPQDESKTVSSSEACTSKECVSEGTWCDCLVQAWIRASMALRCFTEEVLSSCVSCKEPTEMIRPYLHNEISMLPVLLHRVRISARKVSHFATGENDPMRILNRELTICFKYLSRVEVGPFRNHPQLPGLARAKVYILTELWRVNPVEVTLSISLEALHTALCWCSPYQAVQTFLYFGIHSLHRGNTRLAEESFAKSFLVATNMRGAELSTSLQRSPKGRGCGPHGLGVPTILEGNKSVERVILTFWILCNMTRGWIPSTELLETYQVTCFHGILLSLQTGRLDIFDYSVEFLRSFFMQNGMILLILRIRQIVIRNFVARFYAANPSAVHEVQLDALHKDLTRSTVVQEKIGSVEKLRDLYILPLVMTNLISGRIYVHLNVLKLSKTTPFPDIVLDDGIPVAPEEPIQL